MDPSTIKGLLINMAILARADGVVDPLEKRFVQRFLERVGVANAQANRWLAEAQSEGWRFHPAVEREQALALMKLMVGVASADGKVEAKETDTLILMAKACNITRDELVALLEQYHDKDVLADLAPLLSPAAAEQATGPRVALIAEGFPAIENLAAANPTLQFERHTLDAVLAGTMKSQAIVFHAFEDRQASLDTVKTLKNLYPHSKIIVVVRRDQAFQIRYLMEQAIHRCLVEPIFPNEIAQALREESH
jgi:uncharacterized tellurite resistance protein B-like protein